jgi:putative hemolysin
MKKLFWLIPIMILSVLIIWQIVAHSISTVTQQRAHEYAAKAEVYCQQNGYRTDYCF